MKSVEETVLAKTVMTSPVVCVNVHERLDYVEQRLVDAHVTGLPVVEDGMLVGIITRSDYVRVPILLKAFDEYVAERRYEDGMQQQQRDEFQEFRSRLGTLTVRDVMTNKVVTCDADTPAHEVADKMLNHHVHRVVVVEQGRPIGVVGSLDLVKLLRG